MDKLKKMQKRPLNLLLGLIYTFLIGCGNASESPVNAPESTTSPTPISSSPVPQPDEDSGPRKCEEPKKCPLPERTKEYKDLRDAFLKALELCHEQSREFPVKELLRHLEDREHGRGQVPKKRD
jgi:hypothetical protein